MCALLPSYHERFDESCELRYHLHRHGNQYASRGQVMPDACRHQWRHLLFNVDICELCGARSADTVIHPPRRRRQRAHPRQLKMCDHEWSKLIRDTEICKECGITRQTPRSNPGRRRSNPVRPMSRPMVLYRSISLPEFVDILRKGKIIGGGNLFSMDKRPEVFFSAKLDQELIAQGEDVNRQVEHAIYDKELDEQYKDASRTWARAQEGKSVDPTALKAADRTMERVRKVFRDRYAQKLDEITGTLKKLPYSSAIVVTKPYQGGTEYSLEDSRMGKDWPEYGFPSGMVKIGDIDHFIMVKSGRMVMELSVEDAPYVAMQLEEKLGMQ